jgi:two-component system, NtrC family, response regulator HydG
VALGRIQGGGRPERTFDLILMDVRMARMSGIDALKLIKAHTPAIPALIMTAYSSVD